MKVNFEIYKDGLAPVIVQDARTQKVLIFGYMNRKAFKRTEKRKKVTFYSPSEKKLFTHGEENGNFIKVQEILINCDNQAILIKAYPKGKICRNGKRNQTCFNEKNKTDNFLYDFEKFVEDKKNKPIKSSYTSRMFARGVNYIAKKFGEESIELVIEAKDPNDKLFKAEAADMLYFFMVLIVERRIKLDEILDVLKKRRR